MSTDLQPLFQPSSIAIIGASADESKYSRQVVDSLHTLQYKGKIYLVNKNNQSILGKQVYKQVSDIPGEVDLAMIFVPARVVPSAIKDCARKGVKAAIVHGAGFAELGKKGQLQQDAMAKVAHSSGMRIVGPNCMGIACPSSGINMVTTQHPLVDTGGFSFSGQSGWATEYALIVGQDRGLGFRFVASCGNQADLSITDYIDYFGNDPDTKVIGAYVEGFKEGQRFLDSARQTARRKPVVIWKSGRTNAGARFTQSHTGSLAGDGEMTRAILNQVGVEEAMDIEDLMDAVVAFSSPVLPHGRRVGLVVSSGAIVIAACDVCEAIGLEIPQPPNRVQQELRRYLKQYLPPFAGITNPIDLVSVPHDKRDEIISRCMEWLSPWVDTFIIGRFPGDNQEEIACQLAELRDRFQKPILTVCFYGHVMQPFMRLCTKNGVPSFSSMECAVRALMRLVRRSEWLEHQ